MTFYEQMTTQSAVKASRQYTNIPLCQIPPQQTVFCFREVNVMLVDFSLSQGSLMMN
jgi:hypothetical protein